MKTDIDEMRAEMRAQMAEVTDTAAARYTSLIAERDSHLVALHAERSVLHDAVMSHLPFWMVRYDYMRDYAWNHGHTHAGGWRPIWKVMVAEVAELFAEDGDKAELLPALEIAMMNVNAWTGAQMRGHLNAIRERAHDLELARPSRYSQARIALTAKDEEIKKYTEDMRSRLKEVGAGSSSLIQVAVCLVALRDVVGLGWSSMLLRVVIESMFHFRVMYHRVL